MKPRHVLFGLLAVAAALLNLVLAARIEYAGHDWADAVTVLAMALAFAQIAPLCLWLVWGQWNLTIRVAALLGVVVASSWLCVRATTNDLWQWFTVLSIYAAITCCGFLAAGFAGYEVDDIVARRDRAASGGSQRQWQFSIFNLLSWMTSFALVLWSTQWYGRPIGDAAGLIVGLSGLALLSIVVSLFVLRLRFVGWALALLFLCPATGIVLASLLVRQSTELTTMIFLMCALTCPQGLFVALAVLVIRVAGYRLVSRRVESVGGCDTGGLTPTVGLNDPS